MASLEAFSPDFSDHKLVVGGVFNFYQKTALVPLTNITCALFRGIGVWCCERISSNAATPSSRKHPSHHALYLADDICVLLQDCRFYT
jgi:hypothetical protein